MVEIPFFKAWNPEETGFKSLRSLSWVIFELGLKGIPSSTTQLCFKWWNPKIHYITNPNNAIGIREIPQSYHRFVLLDSPKISNLMTPEPRSWVTWDPVQHRDCWIELSSAQNEIPSLYHPSQGRQGKGSKGIGPNELWFLEWRLGCIQVYILMYGKK